MFKVDDVVFNNYSNERVIIVGYDSHQDLFIVTNVDNEVYVSPPDHLYNVDDADTKPANPKDDIIFGDGSGEVLLEFNGNIEREWKPSNPKDAIGCDKLLLHLWPTTATAMGSLALLEGALKYGRSNWRECGVKSSIYIDACRRHLDAWLEGEEVAPDTGTPHLASALACLAIIVDAQAAGKLNDDRNYNGSGYRKLVDNLTPHVRRLKDLFADKNPKHYTIEDNK